jgi:cystathionine beta-lyase
MTNHSFDNQMSPETYLCHGPFDPEVFGGVVNSACISRLYGHLQKLQELNERHQALFEDAEDEVMYYGRFGTPITFAVQKALAELEGVPIFTGAYRAGSMHQCITGSGKKWRSYSCQYSVYGPTRGFVNNVLAKMGVSATFFDPTIGDGIGQLFQENTTVVFTESPGSQTFDIQDIPAITRVAHAHSAKVIIDNTWATPLFFKPFEHGVDVSVHAATKYIVGHSDAQMGLITTNKETWLAIRRFIYLFGLHAAPDDVYLAQRDYTMSLRLGRHQIQRLKLLNGLKNVKKWSRCYTRHCLHVRGTKFGNVTSPVPAVCLAWCLNRTTQKYCGEVY